MPLVPCRRTGKGGMNGSLRYELDHPKNQGTELGLIMRDVYEVILEEEVEHLGRLGNGDPSGMADIMVLGGELAGPEGDLLEPSCRAVRGVWVCVWHVGLCTAYGPCFLRVALLWHRSYSCVALL